MTKINLREHYPFQRYDYVIEVTDEVAEFMIESERTEAAYQRRLCRHKAYYSLDRDDGTEYDAVFIALSPHELYEREVTYEQLHAALAQLPDIQAKRIYAHYFIGMSQASIARAEGVSRKSVCVSIAHGLQNLERILKKLY